MAIVAKRIVMHLYSDPDDLYSHQVRLVLAEKGVNVEIIPVDADDLPESVDKLNPYRTTPILIDRDLVLYNANIIMEYLDERFPHPPLLPVYPVMRAQCRKMMYRIERDWYSLVRKMAKGSAEEADVARRQFADSLIALAPLFAEKAFFFTDEFSLIDCVIAPLLWRLPKYGIELPPKAKAIQTYAEQVFARESFQTSLTDVEREIRERAA